MLKTYNRPLPEIDKRWGLIVDYWGVSGFLDKALAIFSDDIQPDQVIEKRDAENVFRALRQRRLDVLAMFPDKLDRTNIEPWILALESEDTRAIFQARYRAFYRTLEQLLPDERALAYLGDFAWLRRLRREMIAHYSVEDTQLPDCSQRVRELIDRHVKGEEVHILLKPIEIMSEQFSQEIQKLQTPRAKASRMEHAITKNITVKLHEDPVFYESIKERLERIIRERREQRIDDTEEFRLLMVVKDEIIDRQTSDAESLGISKEALPFYDLLNQDTTNTNDTNNSQLGQLAEAVLDSLKQEAVIDWISKEDIQREMRRKVKRQLRLAGIKGRKLENLTTSIMDLARVRLA